MVAHIQNGKTTMPTAIDFFCGAGGLSKGFEDAGFSILYATDISEDAIKTYNLNRKGSTKACTNDIKELNGVQILKSLKLKKGMLDAVIGGPPCQGFSLAGNIGRKGTKDERNRLFLEFVRMVDELQPKLFVMENVASIVRHSNGKTVQIIKKHFEEIGYKTDYSVLNAVNYGVPQYRRRIFFIGNRINVKNSFPEPTHDGIKRKLLTVGKVLNDLPSLQSGGSSNVFNHEAMSHTNGMLMKMKYVKDGGDRFQIPEKLRPQKGDARKYIRYKSNAPSVCVTGDMRKIFHYSQNRALTVRELARLQTFPDNYVFLGAKISQQLQVGNAVPPQLAKAVAKELMKNLSKYGGNNGYGIAIQRVSNNKFHRK